MDLKRKEKVICCSPGEGYIWHSAASYRRQDWGRSGDPEDKPWGQGWGRHTGRTDHSRSGVGGRRRTRPDSPDTPRQEDRPSPEISNNLPLSAGTGSLSVWRTFSLFRDALNCFKSHFKIETYISRSYQFPQHHIRRNCISRDYTVTTYKAKVAISQKL